MTNHYQHIKNPSVSIQGFEGSFHHIAATEIWGQDVTLSMRSTFAEVFDDIESDRVDFALVAVENTITGSVIEPIDLLTKRQMHVVGEIILHIRQNLIVIPGTTIDQLERVYSHPVALQQCLQFFSHYPNVSLVSTDDTGRSVAVMMEKGLQSNGSVASRLAAKIYGAEVLQPDIQTNNENYTRFFILAANSYREEEMDGEYKSSLIFEVAHRSGALASCLNVIANEKGNLVKIESRPIPGRPWEYTILVDLIADLRSDARKKMFERIAETTKHLKILGTYIPGKTFES